MSVYKDTSKCGPGGGQRHNSWRAEIYIKGIKKRLGRFKTKEEAVRAVEIARGIRPLFNK